MTKYSVFIKRIGKRPIKVTTNSLKHAHAIRRRSMTKVAIRPRGSKRKLRYQ